LLPPPAYFPKNVSLNKHGYENVQTIINNNQAFDATTFELIANEQNALVLDVRHQDNFCNGHIPNSIFIGINGQFAPWVGAMILDIKQPILLVCPVGKEEETITRLSRVGYDNTLGYLKGGFDSWQKANLEIDSIFGITADDFANLSKTENLNVFDVRKPGEFSNEHVEIAKSTPLDFLNDHLSEFPKNEPFYVHCAGGYRSVIAASILKSRGFHDIIDIKGGYDAIKKTDMKTSAVVCSSNLK
jgi:hydroxyacylglutathione hydrolase